VLAEQESMVKAAGELAPLPMTVTRLAQILARPDWDLDEVEEAIAFDQALTPKLLRMANSALASRGHPIATVREAVMRVGTGSIFSIAMALGVQSRFKPALPHYGMAEGALWVHSVSAALAVETLATTTKRKLPVESFTAALLHDVGKLVMARFLEPEAVARLRTAEELGREQAREVEVEVLGIEHCELGAIVARHWQLPERLIDGILFHHYPGESKQPVVQVVHVAEAVARIVDARRIGRPLPPGEGVVASVARESLQLDDAAITKLADLVETRIGEVLQRYS
jgi:putative nucleotidyltransferase with HDIG domain